MGCSILAVLMGLAWDTSASTQAANPAKQAAKAQIITTLRSARRLLATADRDYNGHRAKAAHEVTRALRELGFHPRHAQRGSPTRTGQAKMHEPQAASDAQLQQAQQLLQGALAQLSGTHPKATANVQAAIREIGVALSIK